MKEGWSLRAGVLAQKPRKCLMASTLASRVRDTVRSRWPCLGLIGQPIGSDDVRDARKAENALNGNVLVTFPECHCIGDCQGEVCVCVTIRTMAGLESRVMAPRVSDRMTMSRVGWTPKKPKAAMMAGSLEVVG